MKKKSTGDLKQELMEQADLSKYMRDNETQFTNTDTAQALSKLCQDMAITKAELARQAGTSEVYLYQVLSGRRTPSRDRLLCICIGMGASLEVVQDLLKQVGYAPIYLKHRRDAVICHGILNHLPLAVINDNLFAENEKTLC